MRTFRGHAGSDAEISYRKPREIEADYTRDPLLSTASCLHELGASASDILACYDTIRLEIDDEAQRLRHEPRLSSAAEVMAPIAPRNPVRVAETVAALRDTQPEDQPRSRTLAESINATLDELLAADRRVIIFGEDVGVKGGVYGVTARLARTHGAARVFDTLLDEQAILGLGLGAGLAGLIPIPEVQYLAYLHNAEDQLRGEGATLRSSPVAASPTRWSSASQVLATRKASAGTSTMTMLWRCCVTFPDLSSHARRGATTQLPCCGPVAGCHHRLDAVGLS